MRVYSTASRRKEELPAPPGPIGMYFCGPTVYQPIHVGNARPFVISMWLKRWLELNGYEVALVENITDINDKIYAAAPGASAELAADASRRYVEDTEGLGLGRPDAEPKASETVGEIVRLIEELIERGAAYQANGDVYFRVSSFDEYGRLSGRASEDGVPPNPSEEQEPSELKENPRDFALWKAHKQGEDTSWESPWGRGRPGWHIECSAMAELHLGPRFEIHGGGVDLVFPHHENEIAQSRSAGRDFAQIWMHNGMLRMAGEKMSKSLGNVASLRDVLDRYGRKPLLLYFLRGHWRKPIDFSDEAMLSASADWLGFEGAFRVPEAEPPPGQWERFAEALDDDFNTPAALAVLHDWRAKGYWTLLKRGLNVFGLDLPAMAGTGPPPRVIELGEQREAARRRGDFALADERRDEILAEGWEVQDLADGPRYIPR